MAHSLGPGLRVVSSLNPVARFQIQTRPRSPNLECNGFTVEATPAAPVDCKIAKTNESRAQIDIHVFSKSWRAVNVL